MSIFMELNPDLILESLHQGIQSSSPEHTHHIAQSLAQVLPANSTLALYGDLGSGKTTFIAGLAQAWGITQPITSPTFALMHMYSGTRMLMHIDAYRLTHPEQAQSLGIEEWLVPPFCLAIEWPQKLGAYLPHDCWKLYFNITSAGVHHLELR